MGMIKDALLQDVREIADAMDADRNDPTNPLLVDWLWWDVVDHVVGTLMAGDYKMSGREEWKAAVDQVRGLFCLPPGFMAQPVEISSDEWYEAWMGMEQQPQVGARIKVPLPDQRPNGRVRVLLRGGGCRDQDYILGPDSVQIQGGNPPSEDNGWDDLRVCPSDPATGQVYTCVDVSCPVHGPVNKAIYVVPEQDVREIEKWIEKQLV